MRCLTLLLCIMLITGCSRLSLDGLASTGSAAVASAGATVLTGSPLAGAAVGAAAGVGTDILIPDPVHVATDFCTTNPEQCDRFLLVQAFEKVWMWIVGLIGVLVIMAWLIPGPQTLFFWRKNNAIQEQETGRLPRNKQARRL